ncbi:MAG: toll/interleukin-1 receptor domain-containing protein [Paracoccaceae bacterium]
MHAIEPAFRVMETTTSPLAGITAFIFWKGFVNVAFMTDSAAHFTCFISYSTKDGAAAQILVNQLESVGLTCWIAPRNIAPGAIWTEEIMRGIAASDCFVLLYSGAANISGHVYREVTRAANLEKIIYPIRLEDVALAERLDYLIQTHHWIDAMDGRLEEKAISLADTIKGVRPHPGVPVSKRIENPFATEVDHHGPLLPAPSQNEVWTDRIGTRFAASIDGAKLGPDGVQWSVPLILTWCAENLLLLAQSQRVFSIDLETSNLKEVFSVPRWREVLILDVATDPDLKSAMYVGNTFRRHTSVSTYGSSENYSWASKMTSYHNPDWGRVIASPDGQMWIHTGLATGARSENWLKRLLNIPDASGRGYEVTVLERGHRKLAHYTVEAPLPRHGTRLMVSPSGTYIGLFERSFVAAIPILTEDDRQSFYDWLPDLQSEIMCRLMAWHPTRDVYACVTGWAPGEREGVAIIDAATKACLHRVDLNVKSPILSLDWSADGRFLAFGRYDQSILLWDFESGKAASLLGHRGGVSAVSFSPDGQRLLSVADDASLRLWDPLSCAEPLLVTEGNLEWHSGSRLNGSPWSPDGRSFAVFGKGTRIKIMTLQ